MQSVIEEHRQIDHRKISDPLDANLLHNLQSLAADSPEGRT